VKWKYKTSTPMVAGLAATASGLIFTADMASDFMVFDAANGKLLHTMKLGQPSGGGVITYNAGGKEKVAVASGMENRIMDTHGTPTIYVFGL
jgi:hypothetical protein